MTQLPVPAGSLACFSFSPAQAVEHLAETSSRQKEKANRATTGCCARVPMKEKERKNSPTLTIAVALARDRLPLSETRDVDVLLRPCLLFLV